MMKLSNLQTVIEKIGERYRVIRERNHLRDGEFRLHLSRNNDYELQSIAIPDDVASVKQIQKTLIDSLNGKIKELTSELRELGVQADSEDPPSMGPTIRLY